MFLLAAERMAVPPQQCLVLEDAELGRQAAAAAGMECLLIPSVPSRYAG
jgi:HAD superfamily hydrolase (TIGR01509 family)